MTDIQVPQWTLGDRLRKAREWADLSQDALADELGMSRRSIGNYEHGEREPRRSTLMAVSMRCGVPLWWLLGEAEPPVRSRWFSRAQLVQVAA